MVNAFPRLTTVAVLMPLLSAIAAIDVLIERSAAGRAPASHFLLRRDAVHEVATAGDAVYPRRAVGEDGVAVDINTPPRRLVSQEWSLDEYLYALLEPERIVGVSEAAYDGTFSNVARLAARWRPPIAADVEAVIRMRPDLAIVSSTARADYTELLRAAGVPVFRARTIPATLREIDDEIGLLGYVTGTDARAAMIRAEFRRRLDAAAHRRPHGRVGPRVLGINGRYAFGAGTVFDDALHLLGALNVAAVSGVNGMAPMTPEEVVRTNPAWIVTGAPSGREANVLASLQADPALASTAAVRSGHVIVLEQRVLLALSPFTARLVEELAAALYEDES